MDRPPQDAIETFTSITGASVAVALQKLEEHGGDLNEAINAHFNDGDRNNTRATPAPDTQNDFMNIDDPLDVISSGPTIPLFSAADRNLNPFSLLDPIVGGNVLDGGGASGISRSAPQVSQPTIPLFSAADRSLNPFSLFDPIFGGNVLDGGGTSGLSRGAPRVSHPRDVREIPIDFKGGNTQPGSFDGPTIEDVTGIVPGHGPSVRGTVIIDEDDEYLPSAPPLGANVPIITPFVDMNDFNNDIEEEMIKAAIEASKHEAEVYPSQQLVVPNGSTSQRLDQTPPDLEDTELARAVSISLKTAEHEKAFREMVDKGERSSNSSRMKLAEVESETSENGRQWFVSPKDEISNHFKLEGNTSVQSEAEDAEEQVQPLVRHRSRRVSSGNATSRHIVGSPSSSVPQDDIGTPLANGDAFQTDEWGGISSQEHDEAIMLEAAMFGGIPEENTYQFSNPRPGLQSDFYRNSNIYPRMPQPLSPALTAQRMLREQQDDEYLTALQEDREKELKAKQDAEAALDKEKHQEEEIRRRLIAEEEFERKLAAKEASLPQEPTSDDESAVTLLVRMPDGSRRGRRFLKSDKLQVLFDYMDIGRAVKPGTYRLVRPYPRRPFTNEERELSLSDIGLTSKQEALFLEFI